MCKVLNARQVGERSMPDRVYVGGPSKWATGSRSDATPRATRWSQIPHKDGAAAGTQDGAARDKPRAYPRFDSLTPRSAVLERRVRACLERSPVRCGHFTSAERSFAGTGMMGITDRFALLWYGWR